MDPRNRLLTLLSYLYAAPGTVGGWADFLEQVRRAFGGSAVHFFSFGLASRQSYFTGGSSLASTTLPDELQRAYVADWAQCDPWVDNPVTPTLPTGHIATGEMLIPTRTFRRTAFFNDFSRRIDAEHLLLNITEREAHVVSALSINASGSHGPFDEADMRLLGELSVHTQQALRVHRRLAGLIVSGGEAQAALDRLTHGVILLDDHGRATWLNTTARALLEARDGLVLDRGELRAADPSGTQRLRAAIGAAFMEAVDGRPSRLSIGRPSGRRPLIVVVAPLRTTLRPLSDGGWTTAVFISDSDRVPLPSERQWQTLFGFTPAEARLALLLFAGESLDEAANLLGITRNTARTHLRQLFAKTGTNRQAELVRLLIASTVPLLPDSHTGGPT